MEEQHAVQESAKRCAEERLTPRYPQREKHGCFDWGLVGEMATPGFIGVGLDEGFGGVGQMILFARAGRRKSRACNSTSIEV